MFSFTQTVNITFVRALICQMTSRSHDVQYSTHKYANSYAQTQYSRTLILHNNSCIVSIFMILIILLPSKTVNHTLPLLLLLLLFEVFDQPFSSRGHNLEQLYSSLKSLKIRRESSTQTIGTNSPGGKIFLKI